MMTWDAFICHASEDKISVADPLASALQERGLSIWYDKYVLTIGDSLRKKIDEGLGDSRYGVVILSPDFFRKDWTQKELDGLVQREVDGRKVVLPVWHNVRRGDVVKFSPILAGKLAGTTEKGIAHLADELLRAMSGDPEIPREAVARSSVNIDVSYERLSVEQRLHRYSLLFSVALADPPAKHGLRLKLLWPRQIHAAKTVGLKQGTSERRGSLYYMSYTFDFKDTLYPGETIELVGPRSDAKLVYHYNEEAWELTETGKMSLIWELFFEDQAPISGEVNFRELNIF